MKVVKYTLFLLIFVLGTSVAFAQGTPAPAAPPTTMDKLAGLYEGTVKGQTEQVWLQLKSEGGKLGRLKLGQKTYDVTEANVTDGTLSLVLGKDGKLTAKIDGETITGDLSLGADKKAVELKRVPPIPAIPAAPAIPDAKFIPNGEWEAVADANGQPFPFLLRLKVEGELVTGSSSSQLGEAAIKDGTWKDGKLAITLEGSNGNIVMSAIAVDGKLTGEFDYAGQLQGKWVAVRKN
jgi:hypothetical protein